MGNSDALSRAKWPLRECRRAPLVYRNSEPWRARTSGDRSPENPYFHRGMSDFEISAGNLTAIHAQPRAFLRPWDRSSRRGA
jgi:hypothetical protein